MGDYFEQFRSPDEEHVKAFMRVDGGPWQAMERVLNRESVDTSPAFAAALNYYPEQQGFPVQHSPLFRTQKALRAIKNFDRRNPYLLFILGVCAVSYWTGVLVARKVYRD